MAGIRTENKIYEVGIYCRLSKDDGTDNESASIATQKSILTDYVKSRDGTQQKRMWTMVILVQILLRLDSDTFYIYHVAAVMVDNLRRLLLGINLSDKAIMDFDFPGVGFPV